ncbi:MAG: alpha/beta hydrolase-fold protein [Gemmatimonadales bacterium]
MTTPLPVPLPVDLADGPAPTLWRFARVAGPGTAVRDILVALPPGYAEGSTRYPVVYLQDGQNCFDPATSFAGHWRLLETLALHGARRPVILVAIPNLGVERLHEYSPFDDIIRGPGEGAAYLAFLSQIVKPLVDANFRTRPERESTGIAGSSMGGLISLYGVIAGAATFGVAWALSPALWYADASIFGWIAEQPAPVGRIWLDAGDLEGADEIADVRRMRQLLIRRGWRLDDTLRVFEDPEGDHDEASWAQRVSAHWSTLVGMLAERRPTR